MKKVTESPEIREIWGIYNAFRAKNVVKTQKDFAEKLGINPNTLAGAFNEREGVNVENVLQKAREFSARYEQTTCGNNSPNLATGDNYGEQKILSDQHTAELLVQELAAQREQYGKQIDRLLGIIEKMQG
jgi:hypothetical protein